MGRVIRPQFYLTAHPNVRLPLTGCTFERLERFEDAAASFESAQFDAERYLDSFVMVTAPEPGAKSSWLRMMSGMSADAGRLYAQLGDCMMAAIMYERAAGAAELVLRGGSRDLLDIAFALAFANERAKNTEFKTVGGAYYHNLAQIENAMGNIRTANAALRRSEQLGTSREFLIPTPTCK
jgi:hypothetical protein